MWRLVLVLAAACGRIGFADIAATDAHGGDGSGDGGGSAARCGGASLLADDFAGPMSLARWGESYEDQPGMRAVTGGRARITLVPSFDGIAYAAFDTARTYDLTDDAVIVENATTPSSTAGAEMSFKTYGFTAGNAESIEFTIASGLTRLWRRGTVMNEVGNVTHDASAHRFMRLREQGGTMFGDVSSDGQSWNPFGEVAVPWDPAFTLISLQAGTYQSVVSPGLAEWESVNAGVSPEAGFCPIDNVTGTFSDGALAPEWTRRYGPPTCTEAGGRLSLSLPAAMNTSCELMSRRAYDLTGRSIVGEIATTTAVVNTQTYFGVAQDLTNNATISDFGGFMIFEVYVDGVLEHVTPMPMRPAYNAANHRRWRIRHDASTSTLIAELGTAAGSYVELDRYTGPFPTQAVYLTFAADNVNAAVPSLGELSAINP